jgi:hypothetical protein
MARQKGSSLAVHVWLERSAFLALRAEAKRLSTRPGKLLSCLIKERAREFYSRPIQLIDKP